MDYNSTDYNSTLINSTTSGYPQGYGNYQFNYFFFIPNKPLEDAALAVYCFLTVALFIMVLWKKTYFMAAMIAGGLLEIIGFAARIWETSHVDNEPVYIIYMISVLIAPTVMAAADYSLTSRLMSRGGVKIPFFTPKVTKWFFLIFDIIAFFVQGGGGGILGTAKKEADYKLGSNVILGGLAVSLGVFGTFLIVSIAIHVKSVRANRGSDLRWTRIFYVIYFNMCCFIARAFFRVFEFKDGNLQGDLSVQEKYFYTLDVLMMVLILFSWIIFHPSIFGFTSKEAEDGGGVPLQKIDVKNNHY